jgi:CHAT domain-containing protein/tetratricopeptide (TPR) repeat protein
LESQPASAPWLQAQAEADMLEGKYEPAVEGLRRALELEPHSPALLTDLATAYFQRSLAQDRKDDLGAAYEDLSKALELEPGDPVALFNRAVVSEHLFLYHQALDDWEHYLSVDPTSQWAQEARSHLDAVRAKLKEHSEMKPPMSADQLAAVASGASPPSGVDQRIEEYLDEAVRSWLPASFPEVRGNEVAKSAGGVTETRLDRDPSALQALFFLADLTSQRHGDNWLADLLRGSSVPHFPQAVGALARAVKANHSGEYDVSRQQADLAEQLFWASGNTAGVLRAKFEQTFSAQMERRSEDCRRKASTTLTQAERYSYSWLQSQLGLEKSICSGLMGDIGGSKLAGQTAMQCARRKGYGALYLRALGVLADDEFAAGDPSRGSKLASAGLEAYWADQYPARRGYNLYTELAYSAETEARSNLQMSTWSEAVALIDSDDNLSFRAMAHNTLANAAVAAGFSQFAKEQYVEAGDLFAAGPRTEGSRNHALETEVRTAKLEAQLGRFDEAIARLTAIQDQLRPLKNNYLAQMFYSTLGELQLGRRRESEAEQALLPALALSEQTLATLKSEAERSIWSKNAAPAYLSLVEAQLVQGRSAEALDTFEWYLGAPQRPAPDRQPHPTSTNPPLPDPSRLESSRLLLAKETLIAYAVLPDGLAIWVYDNRGINANWIPQSTGGLQELAERFHSLSSDPGSELTALRRDARSLYGSLIAPVEQHLSAGRTLVIEADGWLARVPFEALLDANGRYLIERAPIVHSLGQDSQVRLRADTAISADLRALVVGSSASSPAEGLIPLPEVAAEADAVASDFKSARLLEGGEATLGAVRSELPGAAVFHFAGHAIVSSGRTGLMLGGKNDGGQANTLHLLDADTVRQLRLQSLQLAVLSACNTASGSGGSSGFDSVTDALLRSGVPHVVASRWAVESTPKFVRDFYGNALLGESVSNAIRLASLKMLANPDTSHPYYWSAFAAYGRP